MNLLTNRELDILNLVKLGFANKQIAIQFNSAKQTIKNHMVNILRKLDARDRAHAVYIAMHKGLIK